MGQADDLYETVHDRDLLGRADICMIWYDLYDLYDLCDLYDVYDLYDLSHVCNFSQKLLIRFDGLQSTMHQSQVPKGTGRRNYDSACAAAGQLGLMSLYETLFAQCDVATSQVCACCVGCTLID